MYFLLNLSHYVKSYDHLCQILAFFTMPALQIWPCHVTQEANFEKISFFPNSAFNIGKSCKISSTKALYFRSYQPKTSQGWKTPVLLGLRHIDMSIIERVFKYEETELSVIKRQDDIWLRGKTIAEILGYSNPLKAIRTRVDSEDKKETSKLEPSSRGLHFGHPFKNTQQGTIYINESGYSLLSFDPS